MTSAHVPPRCFLCQLDIDVRHILRDIGFTPKEPLPEWQQPLLAVFRYRAADGSHKVMIRPTDPSDETFPNYSQRWQPPGTSGPESEVTFCVSEQDFCNSCQPGSALFTAHKWCWKAANYPTVVPPTHQFKLAMQLRVLTPWTAKTTQRYGRLSFQGGGSNSPAFNQSDSFGRFLIRLANLPWELQHCILTYLDGTLFASLLVVRTQVRPLIDRMPVCVSTSLEEKTLLLPPQSPAASLFARSVNIFGQSYLADLSLTQMDNSQSIHVDCRYIHGFQFALGRFGLRGMRTLSRDGSYSPWLGEHFSAWVGTVHGVDLASLRFLADGLKLIRLDFEDRNTSLSPSPRIMWDSVILPPQSSAWRLSETARKLVDVTGYPEWRPCRYIPLDDGEDYIDGLIFYMDPDSGSVRGITTHGRRTNLAGSPEGVPLYFHLRHGEYLDAMWIYNYGVWHPMFPMQSVWVHTNLGRSYIFGLAFLAQDYVSPLTRNLVAPKWARISSSRASKIAGLSVDWLIYQCTAYFSNLGVAQDRCISTPDTEFPCFPSLEVIPQLREIESERGKYFARHAFLSTASMDNVCTIKLRRTDTRCFGLLVTHSDSTVDVLGQWDVKDTCSISTIYNSSHGPLSGLIFHLSPKRKMVTNILTLRPGELASTTESSQRYLVDCEKEGQRLAWFFSSSEDAIRILPSIGEIVEVRTPTVDQSTPLNTSEPVPEH